jgi:pectate lyase
VTRSATHTSTRSALTETRKAATALRSRATAFSSAGAETFGSAFFDPSDLYDYTLDPADEVEAVLAECAGPLPGLGQ